MKELFEQLLAGEIDGELSAEDRARLDALCAADAALAALRRDELRMVAALRRYGPNRAPRGLAAAVFARLEAGDDPEAVAQEAPSAAEAAPAAIVSMETLRSDARAKAVSKSRVKRPPSLFLRWGLAAAVVLAVAGNVDELMSSRYTPGGSARKATEKDIASQDTKTAPDAKNFVSADKTQEADVQVARTDKPASKNIATAKGDAKPKIESASIKSTSKERSIPILDNGAQSAEVKIAKAKPTPLPKAPDKMIARTGQPNKSAESVARPRESNPSKIPAPTPAPEPTSTPAPAVDVAPVKVETVPQPTPTPEATPAPATETPMPQPERVRFEIQLASAKSEGPAGGSHDGARTTAGDLPGGKGFQAMTGPAPGSRKGFASGATGTGAGAGESGLSSRAIEVMVAELGGEVLSRKALRAPEHGWMVECTMLPTQLRELIAQLSDENADAPVGTNASGFSTRPQDTAALAPADGIASLRVTEGAEWIAAQSAQDDAKPSAAGKRGGSYVYQPKPGAATPTAEEPIRVLLEIREP